MKREAITDGRGGRGAGCSQQKTSRGTASSATAKATLQTFGKTHENCCNCEVLDLTWQITHYRILETGAEFVRKRIECTRRVGNFENWDVGSRIIPKNRPNCVVFWNVGTTMNVLCRHNSDCITWQKNAQIKRISLICICVCVVWWLCHRACFDECFVCDAYVYLMASFSHAHTYTLTHTHAYMSPWEIDHPLSRTYYDTPESVQICHFPLCLPLHALADTHMHTTDEHTRIRASVRA